jgi:hypothetical protein
MRSFWRAIPSTCVAAIVFGSKIGPSDAELNLCKWPKLFWSGVPDHCLAGMSSETFYLVAVTAFILTVMWGLWPFVSAFVLQSPKPISASGGQTQKRESILPSAITQSTPATMADKPDIWLSNAMWRAFLRTDYIPEGGVSSIEITEPEKQRFVMLIIDEFRQLAFDGKLPIWGRGKDPFILGPVPRDFWRRNQIDHVAVSRVDHPEEVKACAVRPWEKPDTSADWHHLRQAKP